MKIEYFQGKALVELSELQGVLDRLAKLEALFAKAQVIELKGGGGFIGILAADALQALDGKEG